jgi:hypothetical protein
MASAPIGLKYTPKRSLEAWNTASGLQVADLEAAGSHPHALELGDLVEGLAGLAHLPSSATSLVRRFWSALRPLLPGRRRSRGAEGDRRCGHARLSSSLISRRISLSRPAMSSRRPSSHGDDHVGGEVDDLSRSLAMSSR